MASFNGKLQDELLAVEEFHALLEAKIMAEDYWQRHTSIDRIPHGPI